MCKQLSKMFLPAIIAVIALTTLGAKKSDKESLWTPLTDADWAVTVDSSRDYTSAVMLVENITVDDTRFADSKFNYTLYRKIRILSDEGRIQADVVVPSLALDQKLTLLAARCITRTGDTLVLDKSALYEREAFKTKDVKVKEQAFSIPGVTDDCIIEYTMKLQLPTSSHIWMVQKDIPLISGKLHWMLFYGQRVDDWVYQMFSDGLAPNYLFLNLETPPKVEHLPSLKETKELIIRVENVPAYNEETYSVVPTALKGQVRYYYGSNSSPAAHWGSMLV